MTCIGLGPLNKKDIQSAISGQKDFIEVGKSRRSSKSIHRFGDKHVHNIIETT